jgi:hypothetical protein
MVRYAPEEAKAAAAEAKAPTPGRSPLHTLHLRRGDHSGGTVGGSHRGGGGRLYRVLSSSGALTFDLIELHGLGDDVNTGRLDISLADYEVSLSGAVPEQRYWSEPAMDRGILEFVALLIGIVIKYGVRIVHGSHPALVTLILR